MSIDNTAGDSGLLLAEHKSVNASQSMTFLGILVNSSELTMQVTPECMVEIEAELNR